MCFCQARGTGGNTGLVVDNCNSTVLRDLSIYSAGGFAIFQDVGTNNTFM